MQCFQACYSGHKYQSKENIALENLLCYPCPALESMHSFIVVYS